MNTVQVFAQSVGKQGVGANIHLNLHFSDYLLLRTA
jgi:hypothetical protein